MSARISAFILLILCIGISSLEDVENSNGPPLSEKTEPSVKQSEQVKVEQVDPIGSDDTGADNAENEDLVENLQRFGLLAYEQIKQLGEQYIRGEDSLNLKQTVAEGAKFIRSILDLAIASLDTDEDVNTESSSAKFSDQSREEL
ncbi:hypothetical protein D915_007991 [Fasciola hepatica]|uniref:Uncharacterized protein n=1 Tax=Fasciola hepatica TaxID=6192 RepID=A0A2H1C161_FASHE|nr:hypothetical protein D915_007991 [Fasciola hepatica]